MPNYRRDYDAIYSHHPEYNGEETNWGEKDEVVLRYFREQAPTRILDAGCGRGHYLRLLSSAGFDVFGIEVSEVCCRQHLAGQPHQCSDIVSFAADGHRFDGLLCTDVLEHISLEDIDCTIAALKSLSGRGLLGIANHEDVLDGIKLHHIVEGRAWWLRKLRRHYRKAVPYGEDGVLARIAGSLLRRRSERFFWIAVSA